MSSYKLSELSKIDDILPYIRNELEKKCISYVMIHRSTGNYLKLNNLDYILSNYLTDKYTHKHNNTDIQYNIYNNISDFLLKYPAYHMSNYTDINSPLLALIESKAPGIIYPYKKSLKEYDIVYSITGKYYAQI